MTDSPKEELANAITHGVGLILFLVLIPVMMTLGLSKSSTEGVIGLGIFGFSILFLYTASTLYHSVTHIETKQFLRKLDHIGIYFLIAGSYTPFLLLVGGQIGLTFLFIQWGLVLLGIVFKIFFIGRFKWISLAIYLFMGWIGVFFIQTLMNTIAPSTLNWIIMGGLSYSIGVIFYIWKKLPYHHAIWHLFVIGGTISHFIAVLNEISNF